MNKHSRPDFDSYFLELAETISKRADCRRRAVGALTVDNKQHVKGTGYNGVRAGNTGCTGGACPRGKLSYDEVKEFTDYSDPNSPGYCISNHAEMNALLHTDGPVQGLTVYVNHVPCEACRKVMYNAGIARVVWPDGEYNWEEL